MKIKVQRTSRKVDALNFSFLTGASTFLTGTMCVGTMRKEGRSLGELDQSYSQQISAVIPNPNNVRPQITKANSLGRKLGMKNIRSGMNRNWNGISF